MGIFDFLKPDVERFKKERDIDGLIKALDSKNADLRKSAMKALEELGELAVEALHHLMEDVDNDIRMSAAEALGRIRKVGVAILRGGLVKYANTRVFEINGFSEREVIGKRFANFVAPKYREKVLERYKKRISYEWVPGRYEIEILSKDGRTIPVEIKASLIEHGGRPADLVVLQVIEEV